MSSDIEYVVLPLLLLVDDSVEDVDVESVFSPVEAVRVATRGLLIFFLSASLEDDDLAASFSCRDERRFSSLVFTRTRFGVEHISQFSIIFGSDVIVNSLTL